MAATRMRIRTVAPATRTRLSAITSTSSTHRPRPKWTPRTQIQQQQQQQQQQRNVQVYAKGKGKKMNRQTKGMGQPEMSVPPIDPENEEFVLFARSKKSALKNWYPFTIMIGGSQANVLVKARENEITEKLTGNTLAKTLGATLYKEQDKVVGMVKERVPYLKNAKEMEFAFKIRNKDKSASWMFTDGVEAIPDEEECKGVFDKAAEWAAQFQ